MLDIAIIGAGTAGLTAAIYSRRAGHSTAVFEKNVYGGQIVNTPEIGNYPGLAHISGVDYAQRLYDQAADLGAEVHFESVERIEKAEDGTFIVVTDQTFYPAKAVILATGAKNRLLGLDREQELTGHGISYCATCDGMFFKGKDAAVAGGGSTAVADALYLSNICRKVYLIHRRDGFRAEKAMVDLLKNRPNVEFVLGVNVSRLNGQTALESVEVTDKATQQTRTIPVSALFVAIGQEPENEPFSSIVRLDEKGYIIAGEDCVTSTPGIFAAGDGRTKTVRQLVTAAGDGAVASHAADLYLQENQ